MTPASQLLAGGAVAQRVRLRFSLRRPAHFVFDVYFGQVYNDPEHSLALVPEPAIYVVPTSPRGAVSNPYTLVDPARFSSPFILGLSLPHPPQLSDLCNGMAEPSFFST